MSVYCHACNHKKSYLTLTWKMYMDKKTKKEHVLTLFMLSY